MKISKLIHPIFITVLSWKIIPNQTAGFTLHTSPKVLELTKLNNNNNDNDLDEMSPSSPPLSSSNNMDRRSLLMSSSYAIASGLFLTPLNANAAPADCFKDCVKSCKAIAPKDPAYCNESCTEYCAQDDRTDGLSGSVSSTGGETGILGTYTVIKGEDKPPSLKLPGLNFDSDKGRKLIGY